MSRHDKCKDKQLNGRYEYQHKLQNGWVVPMLSIKYLFHSLGKAVKQISPTLRHTYKPVKRTFSEFAVNMIRLSGPF